MRLLLALVLLAAVAPAALAQDDATDIIPEALYWQMLAETAVSLESAATAPDFSRVEVIEQITDEWAGVRYVSLAEQDTSVEIDTRWLQLPTDADATLINETAARIAALQRYRENQSGSSGLSLDGLEGLVQPAPSVVNRPQFDPKISPLLLSILRPLVIGMGVIGVLIVLFLLARGLRLTTARDNTPAHALADDEPQTASEAQRRARASEQSQDYRDAVRYLYLSSLMLLDETNLIRYDPTLTNREHLDQINNQPALARLLQPIIGFFDRTWYGFADITSADYQAFRQQVEQLRQLATERRS